MRTDEPAAAPVLLYDGACHLCAWSVRFVLRHDRRAGLRFATLDGRFAREVLARHPGLDRLDSVVWYEAASTGQPERVLIRSSAVLEVLRYVGGPWRLGLVARAIPRGWRDSLYALIARHRHRLIGRGRLCPLPGLEHARRLLD